MAAEVTGTGGYSGRQRDTRVDCLCASIQALAGSITWSASGRWVPPMNPLDTRLVQ